MKLYTLKERADMYRETGSEIGANSFLIELYNYPTKDELDVRKVVLGYELGNKRLGQQHLRVEMARMAWSARTELEDLIDARVEVEEELIEEENNMSADELEKLRKNRIASNSSQKISVFEKFLVYETRDMAGYRMNDEKIEDGKPTLTNYAEIKQHIYDRVKAYFNNEFHYDLEKMKKASLNYEPEKVETIGI